MKISKWVLALSVLGLPVAGFVTVQPGPAVDPAATAPELAAVYAPPAEAWHTQVVRQGQTLSEVFASAALDRDELPGLMLALREYLDPRRIRPNTSIVVRKWADDEAPRAVDLRLNADSLIRLNRRSVGWYGEVLITPTVLDTVYVAGVVGDGGSLYQTIVGRDDLDLPMSERILLADRLASIYGWTYNFVQDIRPGDSFRLVYEREARPDGTSRAGKILAAEIVNRGESLHAIHFDPLGDGGDYFEPDGRSLRLQFSRYPVALRRITSNFNWQRYHPVLKRARPHLGTDFGTGFGTPIMATADGTISWAAWDGGYGNLVKIEHGNGYETRYAHMSRFARGVRRGVKVKQGQVIGYSGDTGLTRGPHLHYEFRRHGRAVNPLTVRLPGAPPVPAEHRAAFRALTTERGELLASIPLPQGDALPAN